MQAGRKTDGLFPDLQPPVSGTLRTATVKLLILSNPGLLLSILSLPGYIPPWAGMGLYLGILTIPWVSLLPGERDELFLHGSCYSSYPPWAWPH